MNKFLQLRTGNRWISLFRLVTPGYQVCELPDVADPVVYVVPHRNLTGPFSVMVWIPKRPRLWVLNVFVERQLCFQQFYGYTFTERFGWPRALAAPVCSLLSIAVPDLMASIRAIPVHRGSRAVLDTVKESAAALAAGEDLLISPDIEYTDAGSTVGEMYQGFLTLERHFYRQHGRHLTFIPVDVDSSARTICFGQPIRFGDGDFHQERDQVAEQLRQEFVRLVRDKPAQ